MAAQKYLEVVLTQHAHKRVCERLRSISYEECVVTLNQHFTQGVLITPHNKIMDPHLCFPGGATFVLMPFETAQVQRQTAVTFMFRLPLPGREKPVEVRWFADKEATQAPSQK